MALLADRRRGAEQALGGAGLAHERGSTVIVLGLQAGGYTGVIGSEFVLTAPAVAGRALGGRRAGPAGQRAGWGERK